MVQCSRYPGGNLRKADGCPDIAREAYEARDAAGDIAHGKLGREAPAGPVRHPPVQFEMIENRAARPDHGCILIRKAAAEVARKQITRPSADELVLLAQTVALDQRVVHGFVPTRLILDEERNVRRLVEELHEQVRIHSQPTVAGEECGCWSRARFHRWMRFKAKTEARVTS